MLVIGSSNSFAKHYSHTQGYIVINTDMKIGNIVL